MGLVRILLIPFEIGLWSYIDQKIVNTKISSVEHLKSIHFDEWLKVPNEIVKNMIESISKRVAECIKAKRKNLA